MHGSSYQDLVVWRKGFELAGECYRITRTFPKEELFGLTAQIRRAAVSIPANIAEGWGRSHPREFLQFLRIAQGSLKELETHLLLSVHVEIVQRETIAPAMELSADVSRLLRALYLSISARQAP